MDSESTSPYAPGCGALKVRLSCGAMGQIRIEDCRLIFGPPEVFTTDEVLRVNPMIPYAECAIGESIDRAWDAGLMLHSIRRQGGYAWYDDNAYAILDHDQISRRYFYPQRAPLPNAFPVETYDGETLACWRSGPPSDKPVLLHFHGNGELVHHWIDGFVHQVQGMGMEVFLAEYRGYGASSGVPRLAAMLDDVTAITAAVGVPPEQIVVMGRSVGSIYAIEMVHRFPQTRGLVLESGIHDVFERLILRMTPEELGCTEPDLRRAVRLALDNGHKLGNYTGPCLVMHAEQDHLVTIAHAEANFSAAGGTDKDLIRFPRGDHNSILYANQENYFSELARFVSRILS